MVVIAAGCDGKQKKLKQTNERFPESPCAAAHVERQPIRGELWHSEEAASRHGVLPEGSWMGGSAPLKEAGFVQHTIRVLEKIKTCTLNSIYVLPIR